MLWLLAAVLAAPGAATETETVEAEVLEVAGGPHCGVMHVISGARIRLVHGASAGEERVVLISCAEMSHQGSRVGRYVLTRTRPKGWPAGHVAQRLITPSTTPWYLVRHTPLWDRGYGHMLGEAPPPVGGKLGYRFTVGPDGRIDSVTARCPVWARGPRARAMWMGYPPRKGLSPFKRKGAWVWPTGDAQRRLVEGVEGRLVGDTFTVRRAR